MRLLLRIYEWTTTALAVVVGVIMVLIFMGVVLDVTMRNLGFQPLAGVQPLAEYGLLYITMLGSPWLLRKKGHIIVESLRMLLPNFLRRALEVVVYSVCFGVCALLFYYAAELGISSWDRALYDQRAIAIPLYLAYAPLAIGFLFMGIEFARLLLGGGTLYGQSAADQEGF